MKGEHWTHQDVTGWALSEKLDGQRGYWDGGVSVGKRAGDIPWANTVKGGEDLICTGFWSTYFRPITAVPRKFADFLIENGWQDIWLDGEFWGGRETFGMFRSVLSSTVNLKPWPDALKYWVYDIPSPSMILSPRPIRCAGYKFWIPESARRFHEWKFPRPEAWLKIYIHLEKLPKASMSSELDILVPDPASPHLVNCVPQNVCMSDGGNLLSKSIIPGSEGWIVRNPHVGWLASRNTAILKIKGKLVFDAKVIGVNPGKKKYSGMIGSLSLQPLGDMQSLKPFNCSGMSDAKRVVGSFKAGDIVTVEAMGLTHKMVPREPRLL